MISDDITALKQAFVKKTIASHSLFVLNWLVVSLSHMAMAAHSAE